MHNDSELFDPVWKPEGFCVANRETPYWNSHDLCLYADTIFSLLHALVYLGLRNQPGMEPANELVKFNIVGVLGHGLGHGAIAKGMRDGLVGGADEASSHDSGFDVFMQQSLLEGCTTMLPYIVFWVLLLKATMPTAKTSVVLCMTLLSLVGNIFVPERFAFTYVQTVLLLAFSINQLLRPSKEKGFAYALFPIIAGFPVSKCSDACDVSCLMLAHHDCLLDYRPFFPLSSCLLHG